MLVLRCTKKLLGRLGPPVADPPASTTVLGDWYAKPFGVGHQRYVLLVSEKSRMAVLMHGRDVAGIARRFPDAMAGQLALLRIPADAVAREVEACGEVVIASTANRSVLGTMTDFVLSATLGLRERQMEGVEADLERESMRLSHTLVGPLRYSLPAEVARKLFGLEPLPYTWFKNWY